MIASCGENPKTNSEKASDLMSAEEKEIFVKKGKSIAMATFSTLSAELGKALSAGGVAEAVEVCNIAAMPLVDSLSKVHHATIRRTSLKIRNPKNAPTEDELKILNSYEEDQKSGKILEPKVQEINGMVSFYMPIKTQPLCLNCHGKVGETLQQEDYALIKKLYPLDQAIDYVQDDLRGVWSIQFEK
jgi:hypothetical protein